MKYALEHKPKTAASEEKYLVVDTTNIYRPDDVLYDTYIGRTVAECHYKTDAQLVVNALNGFKNVNDSSKA